MAQVPEMLIFYAWGHSKYRISSHKISCKKSDRLFHLVALTFHSPWTTRQMDLLEPVDKPNEMFTPIKKFKTFLDKLLARLRYSFNEKHYLVVILSAVYMFYSKTLLNAKTVQH